MNKDNAKDYLPLVQALAEGRTIQYSVCYGLSEWHDVDNPAFELAPDRYRIKPEPRRAWVWWPGDDCDHAPAITVNESSAREWIKEFGGHITEVTE